MRELIDQARELAGNLQDPYWRAEHQVELMIIASILIGLIEIPLAWGKARAYKAGLA